MHKKIFSLKTANIKRDFFIIDCKKSSMILGRLATAIAILLKGKHKTEYTPHTLCGDKVIVINTKYLEVSGNKENQKIYRKHTGYFGGLKETLYKNMKPNERLMIAVKGMLRKGPQRNSMLKGLYLYEGEEHPHVPQKPKEYMIK